MGGQDVEYLGGVSGVGAGVEGQGHHLAAWRPLVTTTTGPEVAVVGGAAGVDVRGGATVVDEAGGVVGAVVVGAVPLVAVVVVTAGTAVVLTVEGSAGTVVLVADLDVPQAVTSSAAVMITLFRIAVPTTASCPPAEFRRLCACRPTGDGRGGRPGPAART